MSVVLIDLQKRQALLDRWPDSIAGELLFPGGDAAAEVAGTKLRAAGFGFGMVSREDPDEHYAFAEVWAPVVAWDNWEKFSEAVKLAIGNDIDFDFQHIIG
jgi:hypothetical protein